MILLVGLIIAQAWAVNNCDTTQRFLLQSFNLAYYPPAANTYTMAIAVGTFPTNTYIRKVVVNWSTNKKKWNEYSSNINITYFATQLVQFAPWYQLKNTPSARQGHYYGTITLYGQPGPKNKDNPIWCWPFDIPHVSTIEEDFELTLGN